MKSTSPTHDVRLRDVTEEDLPIFFEHQRDADANRRARFPPRNHDAFVAHWRKIMADQTVVLKTILFGEHVAGNIVSWQRDGKHLVGYWIGQEHWGQGVATKALSAFVNLVKTRPLYAYVATDNVASIRVLQKCGFTICAETTEDAEKPSIEEFVYCLA